MALPFTIDQSLAPQDPTLQLISSPLNSLLLGQQQSRIEQAQQQSLRDAELENLKKRLETERYQQMTPLELQKTGLEAAQAQALNNEDALNAYAAGKIGSSQQQQAAGQLAMAGLPGELVGAENKNIFANMQKAALNPNATPEERQAALTKLGETASVLGITPENLFKLNQEQVKTQNKPLSPSNIVGLMQYALAAGLPPGDSMKLFEGLRAMAQPQTATGNIGFNFGQQQQPKTFAFSYEGLNPDDKAKVDNLLSIAKQNPNQAAQVNQELQNIAANYPSKVPEQTTTPLIDQPLTRHSEKTPKPSNDSPEQFTSASGEVYTPKNADEKRLFTGLSSDYITPGQNNLKHNTLITTSANELGVSLKNLSIFTDKGEKYPSGGAWQGLKNDSLFGATASAVLKPLTQRETLQMEALVKPISRMLSAVMYGGQGGTQEDRNRMEKAIMQEFGTADKVVALQKLGELRQSATAALESQMANQTMSRQQREKLLQNYRTIAEAIPYKAEDVLLWQKSGMKEPFRNYIDKQLAIKKYLPE